MERRGPVPGLGVVHGVLERRGSEDQAEAGRTLKREGFPEDPGSGERGSWGEGGRVERVQGEGDFMGEMLRAQPASG